MLLECCCYSSAVFSVHAFAAVGCQAMICVLHAPRDIVHKHTWNGASTDASHQLDSVQLTAPQLMVHSELQPDSAGLIGPNTISTGRWCLAGGVKLVQ